MNSANFDQVTLGELVESVESRDSGLLDTRNEFCCVKASPLYRNLAWMTDFWMVGVMARVNRPIAVKMTGLYTKMLKKPPIEVSRRATNLISGLTICLWYPTVDMWSSKIVSYLDNSTNGRQTIGEYIWNVQKRKYDDSFMNQVSLDNLKFPENSSQVKLRTMELFGVLFFILLPLTKLVKIQSNSMKDMVKLSILQSRVSIGVIFIPWMYAYGKMKMTMDKKCNIQCVASKRVSDATEQIYQHKTADLDNGAGHAQLSD